MCLKWGNEGGARMKLPDGSYQKERGRGRVDLDRRQQAYTRIKTMNKDLEKNEPG